MIVRSVRVEGFRCFVSPVEVTGFSEGFNLISAPNGSGKSTLFEAVRRALIDHHAVSGKEAELMRPWGRSLAPTMTVDFAHDGSEWRLHKRFLDSPECVLFRRENDAWLPVDRGEKADERVRLLLERSQPIRGLAKESQWGLAQILWAPQGAIELSALEQSLAVRMRESLAAQVAGERGSKLELAVQRRYTSFFTPATGKLRTGKRASELVRAEEERKALEVEIQSAKDAYERWQASSAKVDSLRKLLLDATESERKLSAKLATEEQLVATVEQNERATLDAERRMQEATSQLRISKAVLATWQQAVQAVEQSKTAVASLAESREPLQQQLHKAIRDEAIASQQLQERESLEERFAQVQQQQAARVRATEAKERVELLRQQAHELLSATEALSKSEHTLKSLLPVTAEWVSRAQKAQAMLVRAEAVLAQSAITLTLTAHRSIEVKSGDLPENEALESEQIQQWSGSPQVVLAIAGVATITAHTKVDHSGGLEEARAQQTTATTVLGECQSRFGSSDTAVLSKMHVLHERALSALTQAKERILQLRKLTGTDEQLADRLSAAREQADEPPMSEESLMLEDRVRLQREQAPSVREHQTQKERLMRERAKIESRVAADDERQAQEQNRLAQATERLRLLKSESVQLELSTLQDQVDDRALAYDGARLSLERLKREAFEKAPLVTKFQHSQREHREQQSRVQAIRDELRLEEGRLEEQSRGASYARISIAEERCAVIAQEAAKLKLEADAIRLLYETLAQSREEAVTRVVVDVERRAAEIISLIAERPERNNMRVMLGDTFEPLGARIGDESTNSIALQTLSGGENEQVHFAVRLALAEVLAKEQRVMLVLDDVMVATDQQRMRRVIKLLEDASERMQIVVLTCHPERYESAEKATRIALPV